MREADVSWGWEEVWVGGWVGGWVGRWINVHRRGAAGSSLSEAEAVTAESQSSLGPSRRP
jgi:hypothetical protein